MKRKRDHKRKRGDNTVLRHLFILFLSFSIVCVGCTVYGEDQKTKENQTLYYDGKDRPDPFKPLIEIANPRVEKEEGATTPLTPLERYEFDQLKLVGIAISDGKKVAMIEDGGGKFFPVEEGMLIGPKKGRITEILPDKIVVEEAGYTSKGTLLQKRILKLKKEVEEGT